MATIFIITAKGNSKSEINKNFELIDKFMEQFQNTFTLISNVKIDSYPRVYYSRITVKSKDIHDVITELRTNKSVDYAIKLIEYSQNLNKV